MNGAMNGALPPPLAVELALQHAGVDMQVQFRVAPGHLCALVGRPGSGKTAVMECAAGLKPARAGRVTLGSQVMYDKPSGINLSPQQRRFAWVDGKGLLFPHMSVQGNLLYGQRLAPPERVDNRMAASVVEWLKLGPLLKLRPAALSLLERQKVALGRALLSGPNALMLRDPLAQVPLHQHGELLEVLQTMHRRFKIPTVMTTPRMDEVIRLADDMVMLHDGRMAGAGPVPHLLADVSVSTLLDGVHAGGVLEGTVRRHDIQWLLTEVEVAGQTFMVPALLHGEGQPVRVKLRARDLNLHREPLFDSSASNQLRARINQVMLAGDHGSFGAVIVDVMDVRDAPRSSDAQSLWVLLTRRSIEQMGMAPGQPCYVSFKSMAAVVSPR